MDTYTTRGPDVRTTRTGTDMRRHRWHLERTYLLERQGKESSGSWPNERRWEYGGTGLDEKLTRGDTGRRRHSKMDLCRAGTSKLDHEMPPGNILRP